ncbi:MAG TPA: sigma 54-interacting transcriptional regulator, partial [Pyrinomonadaceae bacterium]
MITNSNKDAGELHSRMLSAVPPAKVVRVVRTYRTDSRADELGTTLIGDSDLMMELKRLVLLIARSEETVLITGESGTGKELIAHAIHDLSHRRDKPFLAVNCGALAESLLESELFGHVKGAFTGATTNKKGYFEAASSGTI